MEYKIHIKFTQGEGTHVEIGLEADPPWHGPASDVKPEDMPPAQQMQLEWFQGIVEMYREMGG